MTTAANENNMIGCGMGVRVGAQGPLLTGELKDALAVRTEEEEAMCAVCSGGLSIAPNLIVFCERCDIAVHQKCYGVDDIPAGGPGTTATPFDTLCHVSDSHICICC